MGRRNDFNLDLFGNAIQRTIPVNYSEQLDWVFVRKRKTEKKHGAKALKNEDFKDHSYWPEMYARDKQRRAFYSKYKKRQNTSIYYKSNFSTSLENAVPHAVAIEEIADRPSVRMPITLDKYYAKTDIDALVEVGNTIQFTFTGPLYNPILFNRTTRQELSLTYTLADGEESSFYILWDNATGELVYRFMDMTVFWNVAADRNTIEFIAESGIEDGGSARIIIPS